MRVDVLKIRGFKNLADLEIDFDESQLSTVLIGENGTGKSNVIEALVTIFRDLDLGTATSFSYWLAYRCHNHQIEVDHRYSSKVLSIRIGGAQISKSSFMAKRSDFLPNNVFGYYSGGSKRLEQLFDSHQSRYYRRVISPESAQDDIEKIDLRRLFYCRPSYSQLALLTYFAFGSATARSFLKKNLKISGFDSALLVLRKPRWAGTAPTKHQRQHGDARFWHAAGLVRSLLSQLWHYSLAPINHRKREQEDYRAKASTEEQVYIFVRDEATLSSLAGLFGDEKVFFALLETLDISDLVREVRIWVNREDVEGEIPFHEISDGEKQLLSVLGLMRFTARDESLFLLDEPDTHLNPAWKWNYLELVNDVVQGNSESHIIMTSHDPLTMGGLKASQVQVMSYREDGTVTVRPPDVDPRGLGFTGVLTQVFGLSTTVDVATQRLLDDRNALLRVERRAVDQERRLIELSAHLKKLGFLLEDREPEYSLFLRALDLYRGEDRKTFTPDEIMAKDEAARQILIGLSSSEGSEQ